MSTLTGSVALVTGGSRGIGAATVRRLAADGAAVAFTWSGSEDRARALAAEVEGAGGRVVAIRADAADEAETDAAVARTVAAFGGLDVLVANAGVATMAPIDAFATADFDRLFAVNVRGVFLAVRAAARSMRDGGRIVAIGSVNGESMPFAGGSVYAASKGAVALLMQGVARDLGPRRITVNTVQPGPIDTDMNPAQGPFADMLRARMALPRYGRAEEVAAMVAWLAGPEAAFVTGARFTVDGGFEA